MTLVGRALQVRTETEENARRFYANQFNAGGFIIGQGEDVLANTWAALDGSTWEQWNSATWFTLLYGTF